MALADRPLPNHLALMSNIFNRRMFLVGATATSTAVLPTGASADPPEKSAAGRASRGAKAVVEAARFGIVGDGRADDTKGIQAAIDHALDAGIPHVILPPGRFRTTDTLHLGYGEMFRTIVLQGAGEFPYRGATAGSVLVPENTRKPAINIQGGRGSAVRNLGIVGRNFEWIRKRTEHFSACGEPDPQRWLDPSLKGALLRFSPYAAITIDAFSGQKRVEADYGDPPNVPYADRQPEQGSRALSSDIIIDRCWLGGFGIAVAVQPCDADGNGDFVRITNCCIENCVYGIAVGNSQSRNVAVRDCVYARVHTFVTNKAVGRGRGTLGGVFDNVSGAMSFQFMDLHASYSQPLTVTSLYVEAQSRIGVWSNNSQMNNSIVFQTCIFYLGEGLTGVAGNCLLECGNLGSVRFIGCTFHHGRRIYNVVRGASQVTMEDCLVGSVDDLRDERLFDRKRGDMVKALEYTAGGLFIHSDAMGSRARLAGGGLGLSAAPGKDGTEMRPFGEVLVARPGKRLRVHHYARTFLDRYGVTWRIRYKREPFALGKKAGEGALKSLTRISGDRIGLVLLEQAQARLESHTQPGDIIYDSEHGTVFVVADVRIETGDCKITAVQMNDFRVFDGVTVPNRSELGGGGYFWFYRCSTMIGDAIFYGDFTAGSDTVRNVHCGNGDTKGLDLAIEPGEFLYQGRLGAGVTAAAYPAMTRVTAVDPAAAEVRLDRPATSTGRGLVSTICVD